MAQIDLSVILVEGGSTEQVVALAESVKGIASEFGLNCETLVPEPAANVNAQALAGHDGIRAIEVSDPAFGSAMRSLLRAAQGEYLLTLDTSAAESLDVVKMMVEARETAEIVVASRYIPGGSADVGLARKVLSWLLNEIVRRALSLDVHDLSSGFRLYHRKVVDEMTIESSGYDILLETIIRGYLNGWRTFEVPFNYRSRKPAKQYRKLLKLGVTYAGTLFRMWRLRNSLFSADYDERAYNSRIPLQRYWQRKRYQIVTGFTVGLSRVLDVGCGSSKIVQGLPNPVGLDIVLKKLRYLRKVTGDLVRGTLQSLPFRDESFDGVVCSEVAEHVPPELLSLAEFARVLKPGGTLILGTPDYSSFLWPKIEWFYGKLLPGAYGNQHITHYTYQQVCEMLREHGFEVLDCKYICRSEMIFKARKPSQGI